jgi:hypothetical protein
LLIWRHWISKKHSDSHMVDSQGLGSNTFPLETKYSSNYDSTRQWDKSSTVFLRSLFSHTHTRTTQLVSSFPQTAVNSTEDNKWQLTPSRRHTVGLGYLSECPDSSSGRPRSTTRMCLCIISMIGFLSRMFNVFEYLVSILHQASRSTLMVRSIPQTTAVTWQAFQSSLNFTYRIKVSFESDDESDRLTSASTCLTCATNRVRNLLMFPMTTLDRQWLQLTALKIARS